MENSETTALRYSSVVKYETLVTPSPIVFIKDKRQVARGPGVPHTVEAFASWGLDSRLATPPSSYCITNATIIPVIQGYWTSFIRTFNPNTLRADGSPEWVTFGNDLERILFETNATKMETVPSDQKERCEFFISIGIGLEQ
ncbi:triacylglycerol lipase [Pyrrhoderma noxium]|uniref:Triacylglycerol lipase n=1 Tax=Pyrrhoderma noxium TaxID=2282107 RepID=A0A286UG41_9AGAM|nr:triacylglycerol lipase [Pyrrhoderma noxium]